LFLLLLFHSVTSLIFYWNTYDTFQSSAGTCSGVAQFNVSIDYYNQNVTGRASSYYVLGGTFCGKVDKLSSICENVDFNMRLVEINATADEAQITFTGSCTSYCSMILAKDSTFQCSASCSVLSPPLWAVSKHTIYFCNAYEGLKRLSIQKLSSSGFHHPAPLPLDAAVQKI